MEETGLRHAAGSVRRKHESLLAQNNTRPGFFVSLAPEESTVNETAKILPALLFTIRLVFLWSRDRDGNRRKRFFCLTVRTSYEVV